MPILINFLLVVEALVAVLMMLVILMQRPKSEGLGAAFGGGVTENIFGAQTTNVLTTITTWLASIFFIIVLALSVLYAHRGAPDSAVRRELMKTSAPAKAPAPVPAKAAAQNAATDAKTKLNPVAARHCCARDGGGVVTSRRRSGGCASGNSGGERATNPVTDAIASESRFRFFPRAPGTFRTLAAKYDLSLESAKPLVE